MIKKKKIDRDGLGDATGKHLGWVVAEVVELRNFSLFQGVVVWHGDHLVNLVR